MNLLCPNCQKMLTVPEQFAGQLMKCPLCSGTFTVPALPTGSEPSPAPAFTAPTPSTPAPAPEPSGPAVPAFASGASDTEVNTYNLASEPAFPTYQAPPVVPAAPTPKPAPTTPSFTSASSVAPPLGSDYSSVWAITLDPAVLQWIPPLAIALIFILQIFFSWVGVYPGGMPAITQNAWQAAFATYSENTDMAKFIDVQTSTVSKEKLTAEMVMDRPAGSWLLFFYLLPFFLLTLIATGFVAALPYLQIPVPPQVQQLLPHKWAILTGLNALLVLFLGLQTLLYFGLESTYTAAVEARFTPPAPANGEAKPEKKLTTTEKVQADVERGRYLQWLRRTSTLQIVFLLHLLSLACCALVFWIEKRGNKPLPRFEFRY